MFVRAFERKLSEENSIRRTRLQSLSCSLSPQVNYIRTLGFDTALHCRWYGGKYVPFMIIKAPYGG